MQRKCEKERERMNKKNIEKNHKKATNNQNHGKNIKIVADDDDDDEHFFQHCSSLLFLHRPE